MSTDITVGGFLIVGVMKIGVVGCGFISSQYAQEIQRYPQLQLTGAVDLRPERAEAFAHQFGCTPYRDLAHMLEDGDVELVVNLTIHQAHADVTHACLAAGKHVYSEKPLALTPEKAASLVSLAEEQGVRLGCAPISLMADAQQVVWRLLREERIGPVRMVYADCNLGRVTQWNANPRPFLEIGPLFDGAVYPLTILTAYFGPVHRVLTASNLLLLSEHSIGGEVVQIQTPDHTTAMLEFANGTVARLTASMYVPYQTKHFNSIEFHGDAGSLYLENCGDLGGPSTTPRVEIARIGKEYLPVPMPRPAAALTYASALADMADAIRDDRPHYATGEQAAHLVEIVAAINECAVTGQPVAIQSRFAPPTPLEWTNRYWPIAPVTVPDDGLDMPAIGFGCSRYRGDGVYVDLGHAFETALDVGYRLFDSAELYGNESQLGAILKRPGSPSRRSLFLVSKVWNTNHVYEHVIQACEKSLQELRTAYLDLYLVHWPHAWAYVAPLTNLMALPPEEAERRTFPTDKDGRIKTAEVSLEETWHAMEDLVRRGLTRAIGVSNFDQKQLARLLKYAQVRPVVNQIERHPYKNNNELVSFCQRHGIRVMAYAPLSAPGLLSDSVLQAMAEKYGKRPAQIVLRWNVQQGVTPIPSSIQTAHIIENLDIFDFELSSEDMALIDGLDRS